MIGSMDANKTPVLLMITDRADAMRVLHYAKFDTRAAAKAAVKTHELYYGKHPFTIERWSPT
jgi:hypothetical protein